MPLSWEDCCQKTMHKFKSEINPLAAIFHFVCGKLSRKVRDYISEFFRVEAAAESVCWKKLFSFAAAS